MPRLNDLAIRHKLMALAMLSSSAALLATTGSFLLYENSAFRRSLLHTLESQAVIVGANAQAALAFRDEASARETLSALNADNDILAAAVYTADGVRFATFERADATRINIPPRLASLAARDEFAGGRVWIVRAIHDESGPIGAVWIEAGLTNLRRRLLGFAGIGALVLFGSLMLALGIASRLQRTIAHPLLDLARTAQVVSRDKDYAVRALSHGSDEIGHLVRTFNEMLGQIQQRDAELQRVQGQLERRVEERTRELEAELGERRRAELELRQSQVLLAEAQQLAGIGSWEWDIEHDRITWSDELYRLYGLTPQEIPATHEAFLTRVHPEDRELVARQVENALGNGQPFEFDHRIVRPDGSRRTLHASGTVVLDREGRPRRLVGTGQDITERTRAEEERAARIRAEVARAEARASEARAALLADVGSELVSSLEIEAALPKVVRQIVREMADWATVHLVEGQRIRQVAAAAREPALERFCWTIDEQYPSLVWHPHGVARVVRENRPWLIADPSAAALRDLAADPEHERLLGRLFRSAMFVPLATRAKSFGVLSFGRHDGAQAFGGLDLSVAEGLAGRIANAIDNARLYREAQEANRMKDQFLATLSHELRTPLNAIVGWVQLLRMGSLDPPTAGRALETIDRNARAQAQLIDDLLDVSRIISGKLALRVEPLDPADVARAAIDSLQPAAAAKGIELARDFEAGVGPISGDPDRLQQVVWNLLANAIKFTPRNGRVLVSLKRAESQVVIAVKDSGEGIRPEFMDHIFERFSQADSSSTRPHRGLGLGLAIVRYLVEMHGGTVRAASDGPNLGATFTVELPLRPTVAVEHDSVRPPAGPRPAWHGEAAADEQSLRLDGLVVLLVDDQADARELMGTVLSGCGCRVVLAASAREALERFRDEAPDVLLSDIEMPDVDGYALIGQIRALPVEHGGRVPAAALTAYARSEDRQQALAAGFQLHIPKPIRPTELIAAVARLARGEAA